MGFRAVSELDIPCGDLKGVTTVELAKMLHNIYKVDLPAWDECKPETHQVFYRMAAQLIRDWPKA